MKDAAFYRTYKKSKPPRWGAGYNHLSIIARDGQVVAWGFNSLCSGPQASVHSEIVALRAFFSLHRKAGCRAGGAGRGGGGRHSSRRCRRRHHHHHHHNSRVEDGLDFINVRFTFACLKISRPCRRCWAFLIKHLWRFRRFMYTTSEGDVVCMSADEFAADPPEHVSKGHRLDYYGGSGSGSGSSSKKNMPRGGERGRCAASGCGAGCSHVMHHAVTPSSR
eukprot:g6227.t1